MSIRVKYAFFAGFVVACFLLVTMRPDLALNADIAHPPTASMAPSHTKPVQAQRLPAARTVTPRPAAAENMSSRPVAARNVSTCPARYAANHTLVNTGRKALVLYAMTSHADVFNRQVEIDNFMFFRAHGMMPPNTPTALFSSVDYVIVTSDLGREASTTTRNKVVQCAAGENVRVLEGPSAPCDLCADARVIKAFGGPEAMARQYEFVVLVNSGTRGPFFTEAPAAPTGPPPVTWIDHFALGGEKVYTGTVMTGAFGTGRRPYINSYAIGFPGPAVLAVYPVLSAGCSLAPLPRHWAEFAISFDAELHTAENATEVLAALKRIKDHPEVLNSTPKGHRDAAARKIDEQIAAGARVHYERAKETIAALEKNVSQPPFEEPKMKCVVRTEVQNMNTILKTKLPPEMGDKSAAHPPWLRRPKLTTEQLSQLSPALSGYLHEGHYFAHSLHHRQTVVNMGHATVFSEPMSTCDLCGEVLPKYGGVPWRMKAKEVSACATEVQRATMAQQQRRISPAVDVGAILHCPARGDVAPFLNP